MISLDNSMISNFNKCERYYYLRHCRNLVSTEKGSMAPHYGGAIHKGLERWYKGGNRNEVMKAFGEEYIKWFDETDDERTPAAGMEILDAFMGKWKGDYLRTKEGGVEVGFGIVMDLGKWGIEEEVYFSGRIDRISVYEEEVVINDWKTSYYVGSGFVIMKPNSQFTGYIYGARETLGLPIRKCFVDFIGTKIKKQIKVEGKVKRLEVGDPMRVEIMRDVTERNEEDFEEWKRGIAVTVRRIRECEKEEFWPKRTHSCPSFRGCEFIPICEKGEGAREGVIKTMFKEEIWKPWEEVG